MEQLNLNVESRKEMGKGACRRIRRAGKLPAVLYGLGSHASIVVDPVIVQKILLKEGGQNKILHLTGGVVNKACLIKDYQVDPVTRRLLHVDLLEIDLNKKISVKVALTVTGKSIGVAEGGVLNFVERMLEVNCLPTAIPSHIDIDVTELKIGDSVHANDVKLPEGVELSNATLNQTLMACVPPTKEEEATAVLTASAEPEVITAKKPEEGAAAEGAAPAAGAKDAGKKEEKK